MDQARPKRLTDVLLQIGLVNPESLQKAVGLVQQTGQRLLNVLVESGLVEESRLVRSLGQALGVETVELTSMQINPRVIARLPPMIAQTFGVLPLAAKRANGQEYLYVAMADPLDSRAAEEIRKVTGCRLSVLVASPTQLEKMLKTHYGSGATKNLASSVAAVPTPPAVIGQPVKPLGIEDYRSDIVHTQLDPEISDIIITPALDRAPGLSVAEKEIATDHGLRTAPQADSVLRPDRDISFPAALSQAWDDGKTLDVDIEEFHQDQLQPLSQAAGLPLGVSVSPSAVSLAMALELPVSLNNDTSPFDGIAPVNIPAGLERTGIIPISDFNKEEFSPPPIEEDKSENSLEQLGLGDIPHSAKEVLVRSKEGGGIVPKPVSSSPPPLPKFTVTEPAAKRTGIPDDEDVIPLPPSPPMLEEPEEIAPSHVFEEPSGEIELTPLPDTGPVSVRKNSDSAEFQPTEQPFSLASDVEIEPTDNGEAHDLVRAMRRGDSLNSAERAQLILAIGRILLDKNIITEAELSSMLAFKRGPK